ncbi:hypothetical protein [Tsukamurella soli]
MGRIASTAADLAPALIATAGAVALLGSAGFIDAMRKAAAARAG